jgi:sec-independent protein translocase protein TatC
VGLLVRAGRRTPGRAHDEAATMSVIEHLEDLRRALAIAAAAWVLCSVAAWFFSDEVLRFILHRSGLQRFIYLNPTDGFTIRLQVAVACGTLAASPAIFWQLWWFVSPVLPHYRAACGAAG